MNNGAAMACALVAGAGIARLPRFLVEDAIARGELVEILHDWRTKPSPVHVVHASLAQALPKIRAFIDLMRGTCTVGNAPGNGAGADKEKRRKTR